MGEALLPSLPKDWKRAVTEIATRTHSDFFSAHPWALVSTCRRLLLEPTPCVTWSSVLKLSPRLP